MMSVTTERPTFEHPGLQRGIMRLRQVDNVTNLGYLAFEYLCLAAVIAAAIGFGQSRAAWGLTWGWNIPVFALGMILVGAIQHRLAGLGHEASHYSFMKNRVLNDLVPDLFCMFPLMTTVHFYRLFHMAHHQYTNDPARDPDLQNLGHGKRAAEFPMSRGRFIRVIYFAVVVAPIRFARYQWAYFQVNTLGQGRNVYVEGKSSSNHTGPLPRLGTALGVGYVVGLNILTWMITRTGHAGWLIPAGVLSFALAAGVTAILPGWAMFRSPFRQAYSPRVGAIVRLGFFTVLLEALANLRWMTGGASVVYFTLLWLVPMVSTFMFYMFLRDVYQHSNADAGRLTNSRVFFTDPFTRWAVFVYGQDMHIPHHLFPAIPHYRLRDLHELLKTDHTAYRDMVIETNGTFHNDDGRPTILDEMTRPRENHVAAAARAV
jgi:fatty acid desaturase